MDDRENELMIVLDATTKKLQAKCNDTNTTVEIIVCYVDNTITTSTPGIQQTSISSSTAVTDICAAPASSTQRLVKTITLSTHNSGLIDKITVYYDNNGTDTIIYSGWVGNEYTMNYNSGSGWECYDGSLNKMRTTGIIPCANAVYHGFQYDDNSATIALANGQNIPVFIGIAQRFTTSVTVYYNVTSAAATVSWAELAIYKQRSLSTGTVGLDDATGSVNNIGINFCGYTSVASTVTSTGQKSTTINLTTPIYPGELVFVSLPSNATTRPTLAAAPADIIVTGTGFLKNSSRPSTDGYYSYMASLGASNGPGLFVVIPNY